MRKLAVFAILLVFFSQTAWAGEGCPDGWTPVGGWYREIDTCKLRCSRSDQPDWWMDSGGEAQLGCALDVETSISIIMPDRLPSRHDPWYLFGQHDTGYCPNPPPGWGWSGNLSWPVYGGQVDQSRIFTPWHPAIDIDAPVGTPVYASATGVAIWAGYNTWGYGNMVILDHGNGWQTLYSHLADVYISCGQSVAKGETIGTVGETGQASCPHLHFELRRYGYNYNPLHRLPVATELTYFEIWGYRQAPLSDCPPGFEPEHVWFEENGTCLLECVDKTKVDLFVGVDFDRRGWLDIPLLEKQVYVDSHGESRLPWCDLNEEEEKKKNHRLDVCPVFAVHDL